MDGDLNIIKRGNVFYFNHINSIGGVESFFYYLARKYEDRDITVVYKTGDPAQIARLSRYIRVQKYTGHDIYCERAFFNYSTDIIDNVHADRYYMIVHSDYKARGIRPNTPDKIDEYLAVSKHAGKTFTELTGKETTPCYLPFYMDDPKPVLHLISATRLTREKGKHRIEQLADALDKAGVVYQWLVFTNDTGAVENPSVVFMRPRLDIQSYIKDADYLVQLSDTEAYCQSVAEALLLGTPVIVTPLPVYKEIGLTAKNSIKVPFEMDDIPIDKIVKGLPEFTYKVKKDAWNELLGENKSTYENERDLPVYIQPVKRYYDLQEGRILRKGDRPYIVTKERAMQLGQRGFIEIIGAANVQDQD